MYTLRAGINEGMRTEAEKLGYGGVGGLAGFGVSEFTSEYLVRAMKIGDAMEKLVVKIAVRLAMAAGFAFASYMTGGVLSFVLLAAGMGCVGGALYDVINHFKPGAFTGLAEDMAIENYDFGDEFDFESMGAPADLGNPSPTPVPADGGSLYSR